MKDQFVRKQKDVFIAEPHFVIERYDYYVIHYPTDYLKEL